MEGEKWLLLVNSSVFFKLAQFFERQFSSCFNAFSRVDIRVDVKIPGGVSAYVIDLRGERCVSGMGLRVYDQWKFRYEATPELWQETYVSALLRAILYSDDPTYYLDAYRKLDPITTPEGELRFLQAAEALFLKGYSPSM